MRPDLSRESVESRRPVASFCALALAVALTAALALASCAGPEPPPERIVIEPADAPTERPERPTFERIGRDTYIYRLQWLQAEETVETLRLVLQERTGREVIMVPHDESNSILFRVLPRRPGEDGADDSRRFRLSR